MSHRCTILYPADFFDLKKVDEDYEYEYREAVQFPEFQILFYNYDEFAAGGKLRFYPGDFEGGLCVYRGWSTRIAMNFPILMICSKRLRPA